MTTETGPINPEQPNPTIGPEPALTDPAHKDWLEYKQDHYLFQSIIRKLRTVPGYVDQFDQKQVGIKKLGAIFLGPKTSTIPATAEEQAYEHLSSDRVDIYSMIAEKIWRTTPQLSDEAASIYRQRISDETLRIYELEISIQRTKNGNHGVPNINWLGRDRELFLIEDTIHLFARRSMAAIVRQFGIDPSRSQTVHSLGFAIREGLGFSQWAQIHSLDMLAQLRKANLLRFSGDPHNENSRVFLNF